MMVKRFVGFYVALLMLTAAALPAGAQAPSTLVELNDVTVTTQPDTVTVTVKTSGPAKYQAELVESPARLVVDFEGTVYRWRPTPLRVGAEPLTQVRGSQFKRNVSRLVVELTRKVGYIVREDADGLTLVIPTAAIAAEGDKPKMSVPAPTKPPVEPLRIGQAQTTPRTAQAPPTAPPPTPPVPSDGSKLISLDFKDADVVNLLRILAAETTRNIVIGDDVKGKMSITLRNVPWQLALDVICESRSLVKVEKDGVLRIVTSDQLAKEREAMRKLEEGKLKAETEIRQKAAEAQAKEQEVAFRKAAADAAAAEAVRRGPLVEETIRLSYADPEEIVRTLQGILGLAGGAGGPGGGPPGGPGVIPAPPFSQLFGPGQPPPPPPPMPSAEVLAKGITIQAYKPTNSIFLRMYKTDLERIKTLIREKLDIPLPQVKIQARLEELSRESFFALGVQWGGALVKRDGSNVLVGQGFTGTDSPTRTGIGPAPGKISVSPPGAPINPNIASPPNLLSLLPISAATGLPTGGNLVNLPLSTASTSGAVGGFAFGIIGTNYNLNLVLQALEEQNKTRSISRPEIATVENAKATIALGEEIPYATVSSAGTQVQFKDAVLRLDVTPTVVIEPNATRIKMLVVVEDNSQAGTVPSGIAGGTLPVIAKRRAETQVLIKENETLAIGGIMQRKEEQNIRKVPILGDIPVLGWLFKVKSINLTPDRELVVFITPSLVARESLASQMPPKR